MAPRPNILIFAALAAVTLATAASHAADVALPAAPVTIPENVGIVCRILDEPWQRADTAAILPWRSVWLGHFSGGRPFADGFGRTLIDWRDEKVCFASQARCRAWIEGLRHAYHDPEGYWTCLVLR